MDFTGISILVVGDVMLDHYIAGSAARISPEAPVPVVNKEQAWTVPGGAANVARGLARLGCQARLVGLAGHDAPGQTLRDELAAEGIRARLVAEAGRPTICKTRILAAGQQLLRVDEESRARPELAELVALRANVKDLLSGCRAVILSDYAKGVLRRDKNGDSLATTVIGLAREARIPVLVDPKGLDWAKYDGAQCLTPNLAEFREFCRGAWPKAEFDPGNWPRLAARLADELAVPRLLLTRGADGMILFELGEAPLRIAAVRREVADVSGAGDTVIATLGACVASGLSWPESARIANEAAGIAVGKRGTAPVNLAELQDVLAQNGGSSKICTWAQLEAKIRGWRQRGERIVFTNGCFDLLHPGHVSLLRQSAALGTKLIVGLNSDASVKRLKGDKRPVQGEQARALVLAALRAVDAVVIFGEDTPERLINLVRPDVLVKGSDYDPENVAGAKFVTSYGGEVRLVPLVAGHSTTGLIRQIQGDGECTQ